MEIQDGAFRGMKNLVSAYIPPYVMSIGKDAFGGCFSLEKLFVPARLSSCMKDALGRDFIDGLVEYYNRPSKTDLPEKTNPVKTRRIYPSARTPERPVLFSSTNCPQPQPDIAKPTDYEVVLGVEKMSKGVCNYENELIDDATKTIEAKTEKYDIIPRYVAKGYTVRFEIPPETSVDAFTGMKGTFAPSMLEKYNDYIMECINDEIKALNYLRRAHYTYQTIDGYPRDPQLPPEEYRQLAEQYLTSKDLSKTLTINGNFGPMYWRDQPTQLFSVGQIEVEVKIKIEGISLEKTESKVQELGYGKFGYTKRTHEHFIDLSTSYWVTH